MEEEPILAPDSVCGYGLEIELDRYHSVWQPLFSIELRLSVSLRAIFNTARGHCEKHQPFL